MLSRSFFMYLTIDIKPLFRRLALLSRRWPFFNPNHQDAFKQAKKITDCLSRKPSSLDCPKMQCCDRRIEEQLSMFKKLSILNRTGKTNNTSKKTNGLDCSVTETGKPRLKPPIILIYTDDRHELFLKLASSLKQTLLVDTYTVGHLSLDALENHPWINENCACLLITQTGKCLSARAWSHLQDYVNKGGKTVFLCSNTLPDLLTRLSDETLKASSNILANTFKLESNDHWMVEHKFKQFLKNSLVMLAESNQELNQGFRSEQCPFSVSLYKKQDQPMLFSIFQKSEQHANAIFTDSTTDDLVDSQLQQLTHLLERLGVQTQRSSQAPQLTQGYLVFQKDRLLLDIKGMSYGTPCGPELKLLFESTSRLANGQAEKLPTPTSTLVPIEIRQRKDGLPSSAGFDSHQYFSGLCTKEAGRALVYLPVCETTLTISKSLSDLFPDSDQFIMVAGRQTKGKGRGGNEWISPRGCSMVTFNYNILMDSEMAKSINFVQHVTAVAAVDAATTLIGDKVIFTYCNYT
uniref:BPL/LPL catalytic domain-containing protein n=1 Tax=Ditylenchus dipsaci TaxID=166011 RepID=A0A915D4G3_9BILA